MSEKFQCQLCSQVFGQKAHLNYHIEHQVCQKIKVGSTCPHCHKTFSSKQCCDYHITHNVCLYKPLKTEQELQSMDQTSLLSYIKQFGLCVNTQEINIPSKHSSDSTQEQTTTQATASTSSSASTSAASTPVPVPTPTTIHSSPITSSSTSIPLDSSHSAAPFVTGGVIEGDFVNNSHNHNTTTTTTTTTTNTTNNIMIFPSEFGTENEEYIRRKLGDEYFKNLIMKHACTSIPRLIRCIHAGSRFYEYHNVFVPNEKTPFAKVSNGTKFVTQPKHDVIERLMEDKRSMLNRYLEDHPEYDEKSVQYFNEYQDKLDVDDLVHRQLELEIYATLLDLKEIIKEEQKLRLASGNK